MSFTTQITLKPQDVADLIVTALEGGINHWCDSFKLTSYQPYAPEPEQVGVVRYSHRQVYAGEFSFDVITDDDPQVLKFGPAQVQKGLDLLAAKYPNRLANIVSENYDAEDADVFVQLCVFEDVVYG